MQHAAAGFLSLYEVTGQMDYLRLAGRVMDRLSLYQQVWDPPWLSLNAFGGYGVMNTDGEWNDARQAQFAETHLELGRVTEETRAHRSRDSCGACRIYDHFPACFGARVLGLVAIAAGHGGREPRARGLGPAQRRKRF